MPASSGRRAAAHLDLDPQADLAKLKTKAAEQGMPYQTLINSIVHKYGEK